MRSVFSLLSRLKRIPSGLVERYEFHKFIKGIDSRTWQHHDEVITWANSMENVGSQTPLAAPLTEVVRLGTELRANALSSFYQKYAERSNGRILIQVPPQEFSPGGFSLFSNILDSFNYMGIPARALGWNEDFEHACKEFSPTHYLSSDNQEYKERVDWNYIQKYKKETGLKVGLTASIQAYGNTPLEPRLKWAKGKVDFYYSFRPQEYLNMRSDYKPFFDEGYSIYTIEFGANPLCYYPVQWPERDLDYVFLASSTRDKYSRFFSYLPAIMNTHQGVIIGPGWPTNKNWVSKDVHRFLYSRAKVGLNLHGENQSGLPSELNERTYILAACGIPQLIDNIDLLQYRFSTDAVFAANNPKEYSELFGYILANPEEAERRAIVALKEVYSKYTTFHRVEKFYREFSQVGNAEV